jgi:hypothetical protein
MRGLDRQASARLGGQRLAGKRFVKPGESGQQVVRVTGCNAVSKQPRSGNRLFGCGRARGALRELVQLAFPPLLQTLACFRHRLDEALDLPLHVFAGRVSVFVGPAVLWPPIRDAHEAKPCP